MHLLHEHIDKANNVNVIVLYLAGKIYSDASRAIELYTVYDCSALDFFVNYNECVIVCIEIEAFANRHACNACFALLFSRIWNGDPLFLRTIGGRR
jgi:hypothetical protein